MSLSREPAVRGILSPAKTFNLPPSIAFSHPSAPSLQLNGGVFLGGVHISEKWLALFARGKSLLFQYHDMSVQIVWYIAQLPSMMS